MIKRAKKRIFGEGKYRPLIVTMAMLTVILTIGLLAVSRVTFSFGPTVSFIRQDFTAGGVSLGAPVTGDFNRDGIPDFATANNSVDTISVFLAR